GGGWRAAAWRVRWTVERWIARTWASLMRVAAIWSRVQPLAGRAWSSVLLLAMAMTATRSEGGKAPRATGARSVLQALEAVGDKAFAPAADRVAIATKIAGDVLVGRVVRRSGAQDDATAQSQGLGRGAGTDQGFELAAKFVWQLHGRAEGTRHGSPPGRFGRLVPLLVILVTHAPGGQA